MKKNLQRFGASVLAAAMVAQSVALPAAAETTKIDSSVAQSVAASAASAASAVQSLPKFTSTTDLIKQTAQTLAAQGEVHELEQDDAKLEATAQSKAGMSLAALENALADAMYANAAAGKINTEAYGLNKDEMASVMAATIKTYHLSSAVTDLGYETNAAGVVTAVTFTGSSGMTSAMESLTNSDDEVIAQQADSYAQAYVAENSDTFVASAAADGHTYGEPKWYWNDTNPEDGHTHKWKETPDGYWTKTDDGWAYTAVYTCEKDDAYQKVEGTVTKDTTDAKPGVAGKTVYSASVPADKSPVKKEYKEPTTRTDDIAALPCQSHVVSKDADGNFVATFNWEMKKVEGELAADYSNAQLFYDSETGKISAGAPVTIDWECTSITFKCAVCGEEIKTKPMQTMPVSVVVDQNDNSVYINVGGTPTLDTTSGGTGVTLVSAMDGGSWYDMQNNPVDASKVNFTYQSGDNKGKNSLLLYDSQKTAVYVDDQGNQVTNTYDVSTAQMNYYYFQLSQFNQDEAEYFGVVAPFWTSKGVQKQGEDGSITGTMGAIKVLCSIDPNDDVPPTTMAFMLNMLPQAFMSYVMNYGEALKAIRDAGLARVAELGNSADYVTKLLILHDWISQVAEFDMGSMGDITGGGNNDPIQMTAFGALLGGEIGAKGVEYGCICLGYASAFNYMVQNLPDNKEIYKKTVDGKEVWKTPDEVGDNAVVDFAQILYYCDTSDTSIAGNAFGGGMFNNVHYFNAVKVNKLQGDSNSATMTTGDPNKNWYYVDVCYDDVNTECMAQTRVENAGDLRHVNFLVSPSGLEGRYSKYYDYIDSLYDGYTYTKNKEPDKDDAGNVVMNNGKPHYSYTKTDNKNETRYTDTCYEDTWFTSICSPIYFDDNYFYYVDTTTNQNLYNDMRRKQAENGDSGSSGSGSSGNNSQMQQFMKKMQNQGPDTLEARPRNANYYIRKADSSSSSGGFSMSSFTKTDDPFDIILMYYNDLKETSSNFNDDDSNAKVLAEAGTIYKIDTSAKDKHTKVENNLNTECLADAAAKRIYPALVHSTALYDGKLYFNVNNAIYRMDPTTGAVEEVKEYNTVYGGIKLTKDKDGNMVPDTHFPGMSMVIMDSAKDTSSVKYLGTFKNHPLAGLTLRDSYSFATTTQQGQTVITGINTTKDQLIVSVGTNLSNTYKSLDELDSDGKPVVKTDASGTSYANRKSYKTESWNYNPSYNQNMGSSDEKNKNEEFMWCANLVESMDMKSMVSDLSSGATTNVSVEAWCDTPAYTQDRTTKYGLTKGEKKYADNALPKGHTWALDKLETASVGNDVYLCSDCHTATESVPHTVTLPDKIDGVTLTLGTTNNTYIKDDTVTLTVEKEGTDIVTVTAKNGDTDVALTEVQEAAQDEAAAQATTEKAKTVYTFTMPDGDVTISVAKNAKTYAVNVAALTNGEITASAKEAAEKETVTLTAKPATGYALKAGSVKVTYKDADNNEQTVKATVDEKDANVYTFAMPAYPVNVSAEFVKEYKVTVADTANKNGETKVSATAAVEGAEVTVTVKAADNYQLKADSLTYSYKSGEDTKTEKLTLTDGKATFKMPAADVTVSAVFEPVEVKTYSVAINSSDNGTVTADKTADLKAGDTVTLTVTPADNKYTLAQLAKNGLVIKAGENTDVQYNTVEEGKTYTFEMPAADVTVTAQFTIVKYGIEVETEGEGTITFTDDGETRFAAGTEVTATFMPNGTTYVLTEAFYYGGSNVGVDIMQDVKNNTYTFTMPAANVKFRATFTAVGGEETQALEAEERTAHGAAEKTTVTAMAVFTCTDKNCASAQFVDATVKQTSGVTTAAVNFNGKDYTAKYGETVKNGWVEENGKKYWYENGVKQGTTGRGKEIYDPDSNAWYWLDAVQGGAMTVNKDVYQESKAGQWAANSDGTGKWVRYDENGHLVTGWDTNEKGTYYFDPVFGTMARGITEIDGVPCAFDQNTGIGLDKQWVTIKGADYWYEKGVRQGLEGRGKEIYDPASNEWYWLDSVDQGKKATSKDVYQESAAGPWAANADGTGKWVRYDAQGHMIKGWSADGRYYFDLTYGTMARGRVTIDGRIYNFDTVTGIKQ